ncbi:MAG: hypothetical protein Q9213_000176 [Squamulea squamosa]
MDSEADSSGGKRPSKRPASRSRTNSVQSVSTVTKESASARSQKSSGTSAHYRHAILSKAGIKIHHTPTPDEIRAQIDAVLQCEVPSERKEKLSSITQQLNDDFVRVVAGAAGEDDCVEPLYNALASMDHSESLMFPRKAEWRQNLKPSIRRPYLDLGFLDEPQNEAEDSVGRRSKRQQGDTPYLSPVASGSNATDGINLQGKVSDVELMPPPPAPQQDVSPVKTPRPDISIGLCNTVVVKALQSQGLTKTDANYLLEYLQDTKAQTRNEPILCSEPTERAIGIRFSFCPVEGKAYATGNPVYDAQNQAAVSGACALKILHDLDDLAGRADPGIHPENQPMVFSICTEGPYHELWAHYTTTEDDVRMYNMVILKTCNAVLRNELLGFLTAVDNVMNWAVGKFLEQITKQLGAVAKAAKLSR